MSRASLQAFPRHRKPIPGTERQALAALRREARAQGATLATNGEGGLPAGLVLEAMRRDGYRCKRCGTARELEVHHKGDVAALTKPGLRERAHGKQPEDIVTVCTRCHDAIHDQDRAVEAGRASNVGYLPGQRPA